MAMKHILLLGAGKSATVLIDYLLQQAAQEQWNIVVVDAHIALAQSKTGHSPYATAVSFDINNSQQRAPYIQAADLVISLLPPALHIVIARDCVAYKKNLLTASYIDAAMEELRDGIAANNLLF